MAVHAGMAGATNVVIGLLHSNFVLVPIPFAISKRKQVEPDGPLWTAVLASTGQPTRLTNDE
jgi:6-phosphofructokinase 1